jgi:HSP20 family molecular chaperone IbpA
VSRPPANVYEGNGQLSVAVPVPGTRREHTRVTLKPEGLQDEADCTYPQEQQHYLQHEWQWGAGSWTGICLRRVDPAAAHARLTHGVLVANAPISENGRGETQVPID